MNKTKNGKRLGKKLAGEIVRFGEGIREGYEEEKEKAKKAKKTKAVKKPVTKKKATEKTKNGKKVGKAVMGGIIEFGEGAREVYERESKAPKRTTKKKKRVSTFEEDFFF